ncbi:hypothetical protein VNO78_12940 [Psophocarpus tetragonolobus]|uniref:Uncharacterized protein n=1 Tax=Psophocarpus tetragonolobus TaxID=3891 RepID=A0AAN9SQK7_PSOTE
MNALLDIRLTRHNAKPYLAFAPLETRSTWHSPYLTLNIPHSFIATLLSRESLSKDSNSAFLIIYLFFTSELILKDAKSISRANTFDEDLVGTLYVEHMERVPSALWLSALPKLPQLLHLLSSAQ